ncbi:hypothetical protein [Streptomyces antibioticus]|uniref:hypothetical protein n=1 Tax=Streptomyces antibioticus TaxID=1890 RepID=UPI0033BC70E2
MNLVAGYDRAFLVTAGFCAVAALTAALFAPGGRPPQQAGAEPASVPEGDPARA